MKTVKIIFGLFSFIILTVVTDYTQEKTLTTARENLTTSRITKDLNTLPDQNPKTPICNVAPACSCPASLPPNGNAGGDLSGVYPNPAVKQIMGRPISNAVPKDGQILKWNGSEWVFVQDDLVNTSVAPTAPEAKFSVLFHNQTATIKMNDPNVNPANIPGLDNQTFTLAQSSRVVYHTTVLVQNVNWGNLVDAGINVELSVEILNASNTVISESISEAMLKVSAPYTLNSVGLAILPAGTYHTRATIIRGAKNTGPIEVYTRNSSSQGGQMILKIFPD